MPKVIFHTDFFDNNRRYRLPTLGIEIIEEKVEKPARRVSVKSEE